MPYLILLEQHTGSRPCSFCKRHRDDLTNVLTDAADRFQVICQDCYEVRVDPSLLSQCEGGSCET